MKITLIYPGIATTGFNSLGKGFHDAIAISYGLAYIGAYIKKNSTHEVDLIDLREINNWDHFEKELIAKRSDAVGISLNVVNYEDALHCAGIAKKHNKITIIGGPHASVSPEEILKTGKVDHVVTGEGEKTLLDILNKYQKGIIPDKKITGEKIENLDKLPFPDRDLYNMPKILNSSGIFPYPHRYSGIIASRGCPFNCSFCQPLERKLFGDKTRYRSVENVISEVEYIIKKYKVNFIMFEDDTFTCRKEWALELCRQIKKFNIKWGAQSRVDTLDEELAEAMSKAGCIVIFFGFESGSDKILKLLRKGTTPEQAVKASEICKKHKILIFANYMLGIPTETKEDIEKTYNLIKRINPEIHSPAYFSPVPGSDLYDYCSKNDLIKVKEYKEFVRNPSCEKIKGVDYSILKDCLIKLTKLAPLWFQNEYFRKCVLERWSGLIKSGKADAVIKEFLLYTPPFNLLLRALFVIKKFWREKFEKK